MASFLTATLPTQATNHPSFNILDDRHVRPASFDDSDGDSSATTTPDRNPGSVEHIRALQETCINVAQDAKSGSGRLFPQPQGLSNTSLTFDLEKLRISGFAPEVNSGARNDDTSQLPALAKKLPSRPAIGSQTFHPPGENEVPSPSLGGAVLEVARGDVGTCASESLEPILEGAPLEGKKENEAGAVFKDHPLMQLPSNFAITEEQAAKTRAGQYELHLTYPATLQPDPSLPDENKDPSLGAGAEIVYGCNYVRRNATSKAALRKGRNIADTVVLTASPLEDKTELQEEPKVLVDKMSPAAIETGDQLAPSTPRKGQDVGEALGATLSPGATPNGLAKSPSAAPKLTHIEDSLEALDVLEDELEAMNAFTQYERVPSPERKAPQTPSPSKNQQSGTGAGSARRPQSMMYPATVRVKTSQPVYMAPRRSLSLSRSTSTDTDDKVGSTSTNGQPESARKPVSRPASLAPPKPLAKSSKPRTVPTFELPGEAVARRLKEQKEAGLSGQTDPKKTPQTPRTSFPQRSKSTRVLPTPTFELPGEAISRRKREAREAKLRAQEEEEKKRREFKARPIKASLNQPSTVPRDTITSRARLARASDESAAAAVKGSSGRRSSLAPTSSTHSSSPTRGRTATASSQVSRTTSQSVASSVSKRSTLSSEDAAQQKLRGKDIFERDSKLAAERDRERSEREMLAKTAREQAAERSRQASREWAEKQRRKAARASMMGPPPSG